MLVYFLKLFAGLGKKTYAFYRRIPALALDQEPVTFENDSFESFSKRESLDSFPNNKAPIYSGSVLLAFEATITIFGLSLKDWPVHFWIQKLPIPELEKRKFTNLCSDLHQIVLENSSSSSVNSDISSIAINFETPLQENYQYWLSQLKTQQIIWDPDPSRAYFLNNIGLPAYWLDPSEISNGWLSQSRAIDNEYWAKHFGLSSPPSGDQILVLGHAGSDWDRSLANESFENSFGNGSVINYLPGWNEIIINDKRDSFALAAWFQNALFNIKKLVWIDNYSYYKNHYLDLLFKELFVAKSPLSVIELRANLKNQKTYAYAEDRLISAFDKIYTWEANSKPDVAVLISLFNYQDRICKALESVFNQTKTNIELIVVDDNSTDEGVEIVKNWMNKVISKKENPFVRLILLKHNNNNGLAAARNTAFESAISEWCFVLDADNELYPDALKACHDIASKGALSLAVVHPLLIVESEQGREDDKRSLVSLASWQKKRLMYENTIDAMALIRRTAWKSVGGYTHIEGGWEDYDFWCKLIDKDFYGVQCPKILAVYRSHKKSMSHSYTNMNWRPLSRTLKKRHPWMQPRSLDE